jgi:hypothetical protein
MRHNNREHIICNSSVMLFGGAQCSYNSIKFATDNLIANGHPEKGIRGRRWKEKE